MYVLATLNVLCRFFFFKQKTAYEMRISDWSSDVCSSDLFRKALRANPESIDALNGLGAAYDRIGRFDLSRNYYERALGLDPGSRITLNKIGRASCRERVCQYV